MNIDEIKRIRAGFVNHTISFPDGVKQLIAAGVQFEYVDFVQMVTVSYSADNNFFVDEINFKEKFPVQDKFNAEEIKEAIKLSQEKGLSFFDFYKSATKAGCVGYHIFISGKKVVYYGRNGESHTELFPSK